MFKKSFKLKIIIPIITIFTVLVIIINIFLSLRFNAISTDLINDKLIANANSLSHYLDNSRANSRAAAVSMSRYPNAVNAIKERNHEELLYIFTLAHDLYNINYFTITDADGIVLARTHDPDNYGDSVANQQNVSDALGGMTSSYFEEGTVVKVSVRTGAPVYDTDGTLVGVVSAGVRFDTDYIVRELKELLNSDVTIFLGDVRIATTIYKGGYSIVGATMEPRIADIVIKNKNNYSGEADILGERYISFYKPLINSKGEVFAAFFAGSPLADLIERSNQSIRDGLILGLAGLNISLILLWVIITKISKPITLLSHNMSHIADGDLTIEIDTKRIDEVGILGQSLHKIAGVLHKLIEEIKYMLSEHERGNIDHFLNPDEFSGSYKTLAKDILALATLSTTDKLTGIPNRRSFDNRLDLEWNRAKRDKTPLSLLMMDIDKFKVYNDAFGHQQGDLALQTIAASISNLLKRSTDFVARWGGEEFACLLPVTDVKHALSVAENIRFGIENTMIPCVNGRADKVTISIGINTLIPTSDCTIKSFIAAADVALYKAKENGRNTIAASEDARDV